MNRRLVISLLSIAAMLSAAAPPALADARAQARRMRHFDYLHARGVFETKSIVAGVPTLALTEQRSQVEPESLRAFCRVVFDFFVESNPRFSELRVVDAATDRLLGTISHDGYRDAP